MSSGGITLMILRNIDQDLQVVLEHSTLLRARR